MPSYALPRARPKLERPAKPAAARSAPFEGPELVAHDLLGTLGNRALQRLLLAQPGLVRSLQRSPDGGSSVTAPPASAPPAEVDYSQFTTSELRLRYAAVQLVLFSLQATPASALTGQWQQAAEQIKQALIDKLAAEQIQTLLSEFQAISVFIPGTAQPLAAGQFGPPAPKTVTFHAAYFINTDTAKAHVKTARDASSFGGLAKARNKSGDTSLIQSGGKDYGSGSAVRVGKASPEDVRQFVQAALNDGTIRAFAVQQGKLTGQQALSALSDADAAQVVQDWVIATGVGVDCSGFVLQAAVRAREAVRAELRGLGVPEDQLPGALGREERNAKSFKSGPAVIHPRDLRVGDAWVLNSGKHVKIILAVRPATNAQGQPTIEFDTAESAGDSTHTATGPTRKTQKAKNLAQFGLAGSFHRI